MALGKYKQAITTFDTELHTKVNGGVEIYSFPDASGTLFNKASALLSLGQEEHNIGDISAALQTVTKSLYFNSDDKAAHDLRQSLLDLLAWAHGARLELVLAPVSNDTSTPNKAGFWEGYQGIPIKGYHTHDFVIGYKNGTASYWSNRGKVEAENVMSPTSTNLDYIQGYQQGKTTLAHGGFIQHTLPLHTNDNYMEFYIGYRDGMTAQDGDYNAGYNQRHYECTSGPNHTREYCNGYYNGYEEEGHLLNDA
jgi:hypothetical protein